jgi:hypothetical protein
MNVFFLDRVALLPPLHHVVYLLVQYSLCLFNEFIFSLGKVDMISDIQQLHLIFLGLGC